MASATEPATPACFKCNTTLNVTEVGKGIYCCRGFCLKIFNHQKERLQGRPLNPADSSSSSPWQPGGFCRATRYSDGQVLEATVDTVEADAEGKPFSRVTFIGYGTHEAKAHKDLKPSRGAAARKAQLDHVGATMPEKDWSVGDHCRAVFQDDGVEYEGTVRSIDTDGEGNRYANILYIGFENEETQWLTELKPTRGEAAREAQIREASGDGPGAGATTQKEESPAAANAVVAAEKKEWAVGEYCRATFAEDAVVYEGKLTSIEVDSDGNKYGVVVYLGYENEETQWLDDLKPSEGAEARSKQIRDSKGDEAEAPEDNNAGEKIPEAKTDVDKGAEVDEPKGEQRSTKPASADEPKANVAKEWKVGDRCRAFFEQTEYEAEILEITPDAKGNKYAFVRFAGYGNEETVWLDDIVASHGDEVWKKQVKDGSAAEEVEENQAAAAAADEVEEQLAAAMAAKAALTPEKKDQEPEPEKKQAQPKTNTNAVQVEIQSTQIVQLEQKINELYHENKNLRLQVQSVGQCNKELLKDKTELQQKVEAGSNASAETDVAVMNIALYKEKIHSLEATNRDLLKKFNEKTAELNESIKINNKLLAKIDTLKELETVRVNHNHLNASGGSVEEVNRSPLNPASANAALPNAMGTALPNGMGMFPMMPAWNGMASGAAGDGLPPGMVMMPMMYPMMYPLAGSATPGAPMANSKNP